MQKFYYSKAQGELDKTLYMYDWNGGAQRRITKNQVYNHHTDKWVEYTECCTISDNSNWDDARLVYECDNDFKPKIKVGKLKYIGNLYK